MDAATLLTGLREMLAHTLVGSINVQVRLAADLPQWLADKGQLETALVNLATNARDAMPQGGRLSLPPRARSSSPAVRDTGRG